MRITILCPDVTAALERIACALEQIAKNTEPEQPSDLEINVSSRPVPPKEIRMAKFKATLRPKGTKGAVMPPVVLQPGDTSPTLSLTVIDQNGNPLPITDPTTVTTTLTSDDSTKMAITGSSLTYTGAIPAGATGTVNLAATLTFNNGTPTTTFTSSVAVTLPTPPAPVPTDLTITII